MPRVDSIIVLDARARVIEADSIEHHYHCASCMQEIESVNGYYPALFVKVMHEHAVPTSYSPIVYPVYDTLCTTCALRYGLIRYDHSESPREEVPDTIVGGWIGKYMEYLVRQHEKAKNECESRYCSSDTSYYVWRARQAALYDAIVELDRTAVQAGCRIPRPKP